MQSAHLRDGTGRLLLFNCPDVTLWLVRGGSLHLSFCSGLNFQPICVMRNSSRYQIYSNIVLACVYKRINHRLWVSFIHTCNKAVCLSTYGAKAAEIRAIESQAKISHATFYRSSLKLDSLKSGNVGLSENLVPLNP